MKYIITENKYEELFKNVLNKNNIKFNIHFFNESKHNSTIRGTVYLYKDGEVFGNINGYYFKFKYDSRFNSLTFIYHNPNIEDLDFFKFLPSKLVIQFFSEKVKSYLKNYIDNGYSSLSQR